MAASPESPPIDYALLRSLEQEIEQTGTISSARPPPATVPSQEPAVVLSARTSVLARRWAAATPMLKMALDTAA
jgi:hypothetical protein